MNLGVVVVKYFYVIGSTCGATLNLKPHPQSKPGESG